jgi:16S rRNA pseudouridine516 synthase
MSEKEKPIRLDRVLSERGYATRREMKEILSKRPPVDAPEILVAGVPAHDNEQKVLPSQVTWNGEPLDPSLYYLLLHKPAGLTCSHDDRDGGLVYDLLPERWMRRNPTLACVGRLDKDTTGVILITDDGQALHRWTSPRHKVPKTYEVTIAHPLHESEVELLRAGGLMLEKEDKPLLPSEVEVCADNLIRLTLYEGRYHQIKRTMFALDNEVTALHRTSFGPITLGALEPEEYRHLTVEEIAQLLP